MRISIIPRFGCGELYFSLRASADLPIPDSDQWDGPGSLVDVIQYYNKVPLESLDVWFLRLVLIFSFRALTDGAEMFGFLARDAGLGQADLDHLHSVAESLRLPT